MTYQFKIQLRGITKPPVWRRVLVPAECTFFNLHCIIQEVFEWQYEHLYLFQERLYDRSGWRIKETEDLDYELSDLFGMFGPLVITKNPRTTRLGEFLSDNPVKKFVYIYDFGDDWFHDITIENVTDDILLRPICITGKGACPPEDCGGVYGYEEMKCILTECPNSKDAQQIRKWLGLKRGQSIDPKAFDLEEANRRLSTIKL